MTGSGKRKLILPLILLLVIILIGLGVFYYVNHLMTTPVTLEHIKIDSQAALKLNVVEQISKKNGITQWKLKASSATLLKQEDKAILEDVDVEFYTRQKTRVTLKADRGVMNTKTHDLRFDNNVVIRYQTYTLRSETLHYEKKPHIIHTDSGVLIEDGESTLEADAMEAKLNQDQIILKGDVKGNFSEKFDLP